jgi:hypothetical protein
MRHFSTLIPTDLTFRTALLLVMFAAVAIWLFVEHPAAFNDRETLKFGGWVLGPLFLVTAFDLYLRRGYRISFDETAIYWRKVGFRGRLSNTIVMPFDAITEIFAEPGSIGVKPFEAAVLRAGMHDIPDISLSRLYLRRGDIRDILVEVSGKSDAVFENEVRKFMAVE